MTIPRRSWRGAGAYAAAAVVGLTGAVVVAGPAAAHTPTWAVNCSEVSVDLTNYTGDVANEVTVSVVGGEVLLPTTEFGREFHTEPALRLPAHDEPLTIRLVVKDAGPGGGHSLDQTKQADVCDDHAPKPTETPTEATPSQTPSTESPATQTPAPSTTPGETATESAPAPSPSSPDLAETGSSSSTPAIGGAALAVLLAGGGILWSVRKRRGAQH